MFTDLLYLGNLSRPEVSTPPPTKHSKNRIIWTRWLFTLSGNNAFSTSSYPMVHRHAHTQVIRGCHQSGREKSTALHILAVRILDTKLGINYRSNMFCIFICIAERVSFGNFEMGICYPTHEELAIEANKHIRQAQSQHISLSPLSYFIQKRLLVPGG